MAIAAEIGSSSETQRHIPALDGVRGIAVLLVFLFHLAGSTIYFTASDTSSRLDTAFFRTLSSGWVGVDLFFVLSGFLITGILLDARHGGAYFLPFYARRILRIFPAYYVVLTFMIVMAMHGRDSTWGDLRDLPSNQAWFWLYMHNLPSAFTNLSSTDSFPYTHLWSLAIEEQFYLVWPLVVLALTPRRLIVFCGALMVLALATRIAIADGVVSSASPFTWYYFTPARMDTLAAGSLLACIVHEPRLRRLLSLGAVLAMVPSLAVLIALGVRHQGLPVVEETVSTFGYSAIAIFFGGFVLLVATSTEGTTLRRSLSWWPLTAIGRYSYAVYLVHWLVLRELSSRMAENGDSLPRIAGSYIPSVIVFGAVAFAMSFTIAWGSWHVLERPILSLKRFVPYRAGTVRAGAEPSGPLPAAVVQPVSADDRVML